MRFLKAMNENEFEAILSPIADLLKRKNTDYGNSYEILREKFGPVSFLVRLHDKINRVEQLTKVEALVTEESIIDTIKDIIGYATLELKFREDHKGCK
jgi:hypothetical protein